MIVQNPNRSVQPPSPSIHDWDHYRLLFSRTKWYLLLSGPIVFLLVIAYLLLVMRPENPKLMARALIGLDRPAEVAGLQVGAAANLGREDIMMSRTFLKSVAKSLSLQVWTQPYPRDAIFEKIQIDSTVACGTYVVKFNLKTKGAFYVMRYDTNVVSFPLIGIFPGSEFAEIRAGNWMRDTLLALPGMRFRFSRTIMAHPRDFTFQVVDIRKAVEEVYHNLTIKRADPDKGINYISVLVESRDYSLGAQTANSIAATFIEKNNSYRQQRANGIVGALDKQLAIAQADLEGANNKLRDFRSRNPNVSLTPKGQQAVGSVAHFENRTQGRGAEVAYAERLRKEFADADPTHQARIAQSGAEFLSTHSVAEGTAIKADLDGLLAQRSRLSESYGPEHPMVLENERNLATAANRILGALDDFAAKGRQDIAQNNLNSRQFSDKLRELPALEIELGELQKKQQIVSDIYSAVLAGYNKAKVDDAVSVTDFYVMDNAVAPLPPPVDNTRGLLLVVLLALFISFAPVLAFDAFDKSVRSQSQLERITGRPVLESIPFFRSQGKHKGLDASKEGQQPLIHLPSDPVFTREIFDSLQLKLNLHLMKTGDKFIVVSSLEDGAGKSTTSANLALSYALRGHRTLLVDADLRLGHLGGVFGFSDSLGFAGLLSNPSPLTDADCERFLESTVIPNLFVIPAGGKASNPGALLSSPRMVEFKRYCLKSMDYVVIDTPPLGAVSDASVLQNLFPNFLFVVRYGKTNVPELVNRINEFDQLSEKVLGYVLNRAALTSVGAYRRYARYYLK